LRQMDRQASRTIMLSPPMTARNRGLGFRVNGALAGSPGIRTRWALRRRKQTGEHCCGGKGTPIPRRCQRL